MEGQVKQQFYKVSDVARIFNVTPQAVYKWIKEGDVSAVQLGGHWRISTTEVERLSQPRGKNEPAAVTAG